MKVLGNQYWVPAYTCTVHCSFASTDVYDLSGASNMCTNFQYYVMCSLYDLFIYHYHSAFFLFLSPSLLPLRSCPSNPPSPPPPPRSGKRGRNIREKRYHSSPWSAYRLGDQRGGVGVCGREGSPSSSNSGYPSQHGVWERDEYAWYTCQDSPQPH